MKRLGFVCLLALLSTTTIAQDAAKPGRQGGIRAEDVPIAIRGGLEFLVNAQNENGSWGGTKNATFTSSFANPATYKMWQIGSSALATPACPSKPCKFAPRSALAIVLRR